MEQQTAHPLLVSVDWLMDYTDDPTTVLVDVRAEDQFHAGHLPGARNLELYQLQVLDSASSAIDAWLAAVQSAFREAGIPQDAHVVFYEDISGTTAARGVWLMDALTLGKGSMLDGGLLAWQEAGHDVHTESDATTPTSITATMNWNAFATDDDVMTSVQDPDDNALILDTRNDIEWSQGTIPTSRHLEWVNHLNRDGKLKSTEELRDLYRGLEVGPETSVITFCGSGYRAAHTWMILKMLGVDDVQNYAPSWAEWGKRQDLPIERPT